MQRAKQIRSSAAAYIYLGNDEKSNVIKRVPDRIYR